MSELHLFQPAWLIRRSICEAVLNSLLTDAGEATSCR